MKEMMKYEWKKIWKSKLVQLAAVGCGLFLVFCVYSSIRQITAVDTEGNKFSGIQAVKVLKQTREQVVLTQENVEQVMRTYLAYTQNPETNSEDPELAFLSEEMYRKYYLPNLDLLRLIASQYSEIGSNDSIKEVFEEKLGQDFSHACSVQRENYIDYINQTGGITGEQAAYWKERAAKIGGYTYGYCKGWEAILNTLTWLVLIMMIICVGIAPIFAGEYQSKCDSLLLCMKYGKSRLITAKIVAAWAYTSCVYWGITLLYSGVYMLVLGTEGADLPIQILYPSVPVSFPLTVSQGCALALLLGYVFTIGLTGMILLLSAVLKNAYSVIIAAFLFLIIPTFLYADNLGYLWGHLLLLLPSKIADFSFRVYTAYSAGGKVFDWMTMAALVNGTAAVVFSGAAYRVFRGHQVNQ